MIFAAEAIQVVNGFWRCAREYRTQLAEMMLDHFRATRINN
jgi:hypothetical protein